MDHFEDDRCNRDPIDPVIEYVETPDDILRKFGPSSYGRRKNSKIKTLLAN